MAFLKLCEEQEHRAASGGNYSANTRTQANRAKTNTGDKTLVNLCTTEYGVWSVCMGKGVMLTFKENMV